MVYREPPELLEQCLFKLRECYPQSPVLVILDGPEPTEELCATVRLYRAFLHPGACLKRGLENGAAIWTRLLGLGLQLNTAYLVKMDPDTIVHRRLTYFLDTEALLSAGTVMSPGTTAQHVQGGFQLLNRAFVKAAWAESQRSDYREPEFWKMGQSSVFTDRGLISTDYILATITRNIGGGMVNHHEMDCRSLSPKTPFREEASVTHPHKKP